MKTQPRINNAILTLGYTPPTTEPGADRRAVLLRLEAGDLTAEEALLILTK